MAEDTAVAAANGGEAPNHAVQLSTFNEKTEDRASQVAGDDRDSTMQNDPEKVPTHGDDDEAAEDLSRIATADYPKAYKLAMIVIALILSIFLVSLDMTIVATAIPKITDEFHSLDQVGWYGSAFFLTVGSFQSTWGKAYKFFPLKTTFLVSIGIFELGSLICAAAPNSTALIVGRAIAGTFSQLLAMSECLHGVVQEWVELALDLALTRSLRLPCRQPNEQHSPAFSGQHMDVRASLVLF